MKQCNRFFMCFVLIITVLIPSFAVAAFPDPVHVFTEVTFTLSGSGASNKLSFNEATRTLDGVNTYISGPYYSISDHILLYTYQDGVGWTYNGYISNGYRIAESSPLITQYQNSLTYNLSLGQPSTQWPDGPPGYYPPPPEPEPAASPLQDLFDAVDLSVLYGVAAILAVLAGVFLLFFVYRQVFRVVKTVKP